MLISALGLGLFAAGFLNDWPFRSGREEASRRVSGEAERPDAAPSTDGGPKPAPSKQREPEPQPELAVVEAKAPEPKTAAPTHPQKPQTGTPGQSAEPAEPPTTKPEEAAPWQAAFEANGQPPAFLETCFDDFAPRLERPQPDDLRKWFAPVSGQRFHLFETHTEVGPSASFDGMMRLRMPWREDVALRLALVRHDRLAIHFFRGLRGVTLVYYADSRDLWAAYVTTRRAGQSRPETYALAATDQTRAQRTNIRRGGTIELRCRDSEVMLSRGDVVLLRAPLEDPPDDVYLDGKATFYGIAAVRSGHLPAQPEPHPIAFETDRPAELPWTGHLPESARIEKLPDGSVRLSSEGGQQSCWIATPIPRTGIHEVILHVDEGTAGAGVFLGRRDGVPKEIVRFVRDRHSGRLCVAVRDDERCEQEFKPVAEALVPFISESVWIRLFFASGSLRWWISTDGVNWALADLPLVDRSGQASHIGLHCAASKAPCGIRLRRIELRRLPAFSGLADAGLVDRAVAVTDAPNVAVWLGKTTEAQPADVALDDWRRACAVRTLAVGGPRLVDVQLVQALLDDAASRGLPLERQRALLDEAALLLDIRNDHDGLVNLVRRYHALGMTAWKERNERPYSWIRHALMSVPMATPYDIKMADEGSIRVELIQLSYAGRWAEVEGLCRQLRFFGHAERVPLAAWAEWAAWHELPRTAAETRIAGRKDDWQHPLVEDISNDTYNALAELQAVLDSDAPKDAARIIMSLDADMRHGVAPYGADRNLLVSLPTAVRLMLDTHPQLARTINQHFAEAARLRVHQAIQENDAAVIELATSQFAGSEAAGEAHRWLGDRALSNGWFAQALSHYRQAEHCLGLVVRPELVSRRKLAAASMGMQLDETEPDEVHLGQLQLTRAEFEKLIAEQLKRRRTGSARGSAAGWPNEGAPSATSFQVQVRSRVDGPVGKDPQSDVIPNAARYDIDWAGRQLAVTVDRDVLLVSNRFQVAAYDLNDGQRKWQSSPLSDRPLRSQDWGLIQSRPLVAGDSVLVRMLYDEGPVLVSLDKSDGHLKWRTQTLGNVPVVSDPVVVQGQLAVLTATRREQGGHLLRLAIVDRYSGRLLQQHELCGLNEAWWRRRCCETAPLDDGLVAVLAGATLCCDLAGNVRWIRREMVLPPSEEPGWVTQHFQRPLIAADGVFVAQPGVRAVERLDPNTGRLAWCTVLPNVRRLVGMAGGRLIVQVDEGFAALDRRTGRPLWNHGADNLLEAVLCDARTILYAHRVREGEKQNLLTPWLTWLDPATGKPLASTRLQRLEHEDPRLGPVIAHHGSLWTFYGRGRQDATRDVVQLVPQGPPEMQGTGTRETNAWTRHLPGKTRDAAAELYPGWQVAAASRSLGRESRSCSLTPAGESDP